MNKIIIISSFLLLLLISPSLAYYSPGKPENFVNDYAGMLSSETRDILEAKLNQFEKETSNEIAVVTIESLKGDTIENFSVKLFEEWGIGKKDKNNGVLILISQEDREMRIEVGYGLEGALTDTQSYWIIQNIMVPTFRAEDYDVGVTQAVNKIIAATKGEYTIPSSQQTSADPTFFGFIFYLLLFTFPIFASILARSKSWWLGGVIGFLIGLILVFTLSLITGMVITVILTFLGLLFDYVVSKEYRKAKTTGLPLVWWAGGGGFGRRGSSSGFSGFGGGFSGGGGSSGRW